MKIFAISVIKNEADIIKYNLEQASSWADHIFVYDNGSTDGTWEIVQTLASEKITPWKSSPKPFYEGLRGEVFNEFRHLASDGDWWCFRLDADEFYADDPRKFLAAVPSRYHFVATDTYEFVLTNEDLTDHLFTGRVEEDIAHLHYYLPTTWSEARFFRHRTRLVWEEGADMPRRIGVLCPTHIKVRHYQYRSPQQIQRRVQTRQQARQEGFEGWYHAALPDWQQYLKPRTGLYKEENNQLVSAGSRNDYKHRLHDYVVRRIMHGLGIWP